jgi:hypothetical protein
VPSRLATGIFNKLGYFDAQRMTGNRVVSSPEWPSMNGHMLQVEFATTIILISD